MITTAQIDTLLSSNGAVVDSEGKRIGKIGQIYLDDQGGQPEWVTVPTGLFGNGESFAPLADATVQGDDIHVAYTKDVVKDAPHSDDAGGHLSEQQEQDLFRYYQRGTTEHDAPVSTADHDGTVGTADHDSTFGTADRDATDVGTDASGVAGTADRDEQHDVGHDTSGANTDDAMTRSEEQLHVGTRQDVVGKARLRKYIVSEQVSETVPVSHDEVRVEREPITDANVGDALRGGDLTEEEHEVTLRADHVVTEKETVPVERVRLDKDVVTEQEHVTEDVRKEQIEVDGDVDVDGAHRPGTA